MRIQVGVMGSAGGIITPEEIDSRVALGRRIAERGCTIVTGACRGCRTPPSWARRGGGAEPGHLARALARGTRQHLRVAAAAVHHDGLYAARADGTRDAQHPQLRLRALRRRTQRNARRVLHRVRRGQAHRRADELGRHLERLSSRSRTRSKRDTGRRSSRTAIPPEELVDVSRSVPARSIPTSVAFNRHGVFPLKRRPPIDAGDPWLNSRSSAPPAPLPAASTCDRGANASSSIAALSRASSTCAASTTYRLPVPAADIDAVVVTHGHSTTSGICRNSFTTGSPARSICTPPTQDVMQIVLDDSANLQQTLQSRGFQHERPQAPPPYYNAEDVRARWISSKRIRSARPSICSASRRRPITTRDTSSAPRSRRSRSRASASFSRATWDATAARCSSIPIRSATRRRSCASLLTPTAVHPPDPLDDLAKAVIAGIARGGAIVIPAFAVERTQDILLAIATLQAR